MITPDGKTALRRYFAGYQKTIADTISVGLGSDNGNNMQCEWFRMPVDIVGSNVDSSQIVFKGNASLPFAGSIYEVGLIQGAGGLSNDAIVTSFTSGEEGWIGDFTFDPAGVRLEKGLKVLANKTSSCYKNLQDLSKFKDNDQVVLAASAAAAGNVKVIFSFNNGSTATFTITLASGYNIVKVDRSTATKAGVVDWTQLTNISLTPSVDTNFDLLKLEVTNPFNEIVVARYVMTTPFVTTTTLPFEIEYPLGVTIA